MAAPFYNAIKGTTSGTPGTGSFTPNAASSGFIAWSTVHSGWVGLVRYEDGSAWELSYGYWNATVLTRPSSGFVSSSTGSQLSLSSAATAAMVSDGAEVQPHLGGTRWGMYNSIASNSAPSTFGMGGVVVNGTAAAASLATTNFLTEQVRTQYTSATTANAQAGINNNNATAVYSTAAGRGGFEFVCRFGASTLPTGPRLFAGLTATTYIGSTAEPSAFVASFAAFGKDSTDTNIQLIVNDNSGAGGKTDTGIPPTANGWYEASIWTPPGGGTIYGLLIRLDDPSGSNIWYGSTATNLPANGALLFPQIIGGLNGTNTGTAFVMQFGSMVIRSGG
jgi:hypothetical protein